MDSSPSNQLPDGGEYVRGVSVLLVDDLATNRRIMNELTIRWGMKPSVAETGAQALALLRHAKDRGVPIPWVVTDLHMPEMDGFGLAGAIRSDPVLAGAMIIVLTSAGDAGRCRVSTEPSESLVEDTDLGPGWPHHSRASRSRVGAMDGDRFLVPLARVASRISAVVLATYAEMSGKPGTRRR